MLILQLVEIENFVCFDNIVVEPSTDPERPLTVIRAENGSGKTTFLRALRWGMYGEKSLPGEVPSRFPIHPAWWHPDAKGIETRVSIEFEADGSSRHYTKADNDTALYRLDRIVKTIGVNTTRDDEQDFRRIEEHANLMVRELDGTWNPHDKGPDAVIEELLPWSLRDFFVMDTDEATDFVGGGENKTIPRQQVQEKTTGAITSLLGIDVFKGARNRVEDAARRFSKRATKAIGDQSLINLQEELNQAHATKTDLDSKISQEMARETELNDLFEQLDEELVAELQRSGSHDDLKQRLKVNKEQYDDSTKSRNDCAAQLAEDLESTDLLATLATTAISYTHGILKPLHDEGKIPVAHLPFVQSLMESGRCVCGQTLLEDNEHGLRVQERIDEAAAQAERAGFLYQLHEAVRSLKLSAENSTWNDRREKNAANLARLGDRISDLKNEEKDINTKLDRIDDEKIQLIRDRRDSVQQQLKTCTGNLHLHRSRLPELEQQIKSLANTIHQRQRNERAAADLRASEEIAGYVVDILDSAYSAIEGKQVNELSDRMDRLFHQIAANVSDDDFTDTQPNKATLRMISQVGVRPVDGSTDKFEIFALNNRSRSMPPVQINGASRRVMALSFVLALCIESQTRAPLIADSLLNFMSGTVRRNTLQVTSEHSNQPILLLTGSDLEAISEVETVIRNAGATYTLTGQWDAIEAGSGGDVVNWTQQRQVSLLCHCGPRQHCEICERTGQAGAPGWTRQTNEKES